MRGVAMWPTAPCMGQRVRDDGTVGPYQWQTYSQVASRVDAVAAGLFKLDLVRRTNEEKIDKQKTMAGCDAHMELPGKTTFSLMRMQMPKKSERSGWKRKCPG